MTGHTWINMLSCAAVALALTGCVETYQTLRFRPVDTSSQLTLAGVKVSAGKAGTQGVVLGVTDEHGQIDVRKLKSGEIVTLTKDGYEPAVLKLGLGDFEQRSPGTESRGTTFSLNDGDVIPVPLHRTGRVVRGSAQP